MKLVLKGLGLGLLLLLAVFLLLVVYGVTKGISEYQGTCFQADQQGFTVPYDCPWWKYAFQDLKGWLSFVFVPAFFYFGLPIIILPVFIVWFLDIKNKKMRFR